MAQATVHTWASREEPRGKAAGLTGARAATQAQRAPSSSPHPRIVPQTLSTQRGPTHRRNSQRPG